MFFFLVKCVAGCSAVEAYPLNAQVVDLHAETGLLSICPFSVLGTSRANGVMLPNGIGFDTDVVP
jgi:hypothetical protein